MRKGFLIFAASRGLIILGAVLLTACSNDCTYVNRLVNSECRSAPISVSKTKPQQSSSTASSTFACTDAPNAKKVSINCPVGSATYCNSSSNGAGLYIAILPLTDQTSIGGSYVYVDPVTNATVTSCFDLWNNYFGTSTPLYGITGIFAIDQGDTPSVTCNDVLGCTFTSTTCFATWDSVNQVPGSTVASIPASGQYLTCAFIDSISTGGGSGPPPVGNSPSNSGAYSFGGINVGAANGVGEIETISNNTITFSNWSDYLSANQQNSFNANPVSEHSTRNF